MPQPEIICWEALHQWEFHDFWCQVAIAALCDALWEVGEWGNNPDWVEDMFFGYVPF